MTPTPTMPTRTPAPLPDPRLRDPRLPDPRLPDPRPDADAAELRARLSHATSYGMATAADVMALQSAADARADREARRSQLAGLTLDDAIVDAHEALTGIAADALGTTPRKGLRDILTHGDRLRGLGVLCIALALSGVFVDFVMRPGP